MFCWQRRLDHSREKADEEASRLWISKSSRDLLRLVGHGPGEQHEVFAQSCKQLSGDGQAGAPKRYTWRPCAKGTSTRPWGLGDEVQKLQRGSLPERISNISEEKLLGYHPLIVFHRNWF